MSIINYKTGALTIQCVRSVLDDIGDLDVHVVVVDNASGDGSVEEIADWIAALKAEAPAEAARVELVRSPTNTGFSGGHNIGVAAHPAEAYLVLNSDAVLRPGALASLLAAARAHPGAGLIAPRLEDEDGAPQVNCFRAHSWASELIAAAHTGFVTRALRRRDMPLPIDPSPDDIEWVSFACVLLRDDMVRAIGAMDEGFFLYCEDTEYCVRARRAGWSVRFTPEARVVHFRGGSAPVKALVKARKRPPAYLYASRTRIHRIANGRLGPLLANLAWLAGRAVALARRLVGRAPPQTVAHEARDIWINFFTPLGDSRKPAE
ncbi:MAG: glycosyltransferase family 2 protein [Pseudomonadota bacterium]